MSTEIASSISGTEPSIVLMPKPSFLAYNALAFMWQNIYRNHLAEGRPFSSADVASNIERIYSIIEKDDSREAVSYRDQFYLEYDSILNGVKRAVGEVNIRLIHIDLSDPEKMYPGDPVMIYTHQMARNEGEILDRGVEKNYRTVRFPKSAESSVAFPRDLFLFLPGIGFMTKEYFSTMRETSRYKRSDLGESGLVLSSSDVVIVSDVLDNDLIAGDVRRMERAGLKVGFIPGVDRRRQPAHKQSFLDFHIDGHANLITDSRGDIHFLIGSSYLDQDMKTRTQVNRLVNNFGINLVPVDDAELAPLAFNFFQIPDGRVVYPITGSVSDPSTLDQVMESLIGMDKLVLIPKPVVHIPEQTKGGLRCLTNITSEHFLNHTAIS